MDALELVREHADRLREARAETDQATQDLAQALAVALKTNTSNQVAQSAGVSRQAMYKLINRRASRP